MSLTELEMKNKIVDFFKPNYEGTDFYFKQEVSSFFNNDVRFDLAFCLIDNAGKPNETLKLIGVEIKTDKDSFTRLSRQLDNYLLVFDEVYLACENKNYPKQIPNLIGFLKVKPDRVTYNRQSIMPTPAMTDYCNEFVFKRLCASLNFPITTQNKNELKQLLQDLMNIRKKIIANAIFGDHVSIDKIRDQTEMAFDIPLTEHQNELLKKCFTKKQQTLDDEEGERKQINKK